MNAKSTVLNFSALLAYVNNFEHFQDHQKHFIKFNHLHQFSSILLIPTKIRLLNNLQVFDFIEF